MAAKEEKPVLAVIGYFAQEARDRLSDAGRVEFYESIDELYASKSKPFSLCLWHCVEADEALMCRLPSLRLIVRLGVGYDNVDIEAAGRRGIAVCNVPAYGTEEVADDAMSLILNLYRRTLDLLVDRKDRFEVPGTSREIADASKGITRVRGQKLGIIGLGRIGTAVCMRAKPFGMDISFYDPYVTEGMEKSLGIRRHYDLDDLLAESDCITLHCNLTRETRQILADKAFSKMKKGVRIVNTARGSLIDEVALAKALRNGHVTSAALDVTEKEPFVWKDSALADCPNVYVWPHSAWYSDQSIVDMWTRGSDEVRRAVLARNKEGPLVNHLRSCVNRQYWNPPPSGK